MTNQTGLTTSELEAGLAHIRQAPSNNGTLEMIVRRPETNARETLEIGDLDVETGLVGDNWKLRRNPHPDMQLNVMNARAIALIAQDKSRWSLAGDQLYVDLDLSDTNLPPGTQLRIGETIIEVTAEPHDGCQKFSARFGREAMAFVNSAVGKQLHLRGINAKVIQGGRIQVSDTVEKV